MGNEMTLAKYTHNKGWFESESSDRKSREKGRNIVWTEII